MARLLRLGDDAMQRRQEKRPISCGPGAGPDDARPAQKKGDDTVESKYKAIAALALAVVLVLGWSSVQVVERRKQATLDRVVGAAFLAQAAAPLSLPPLPAASVDVPDAMSGDDADRAAPAILADRPAASVAPARPVASAPLRTGGVKSTTAALRDEAVGRPAARVSAGPVKATKSPSVTTTGTTTARAGMTTRQAANRKSTATKKSTPTASATAPTRRMDACAGAATARPECAKSPSSRRAR